jgi:hypothetical protein
MPIQGTVRNASTKALIPTASVSAPPYPVSCVNGAYTVSVAGPALVSVTASAPGYIPQTADVNVPSGGTVIKNFLLVAGALRAAMATPAKKKAKAKKAVKAKPVKKAAKPAKKKATKAKR